VIRQIESSSSLRLPRDQKTAHAALRLLGMFEDGAALDVAASIWQEAPKFPFGKKLDGSP
jgi:hypothetical protein